MSVLKIERLVEFPDESSVALRRVYEFMTGRGYRYAAQLAPPRFRRGNLLGHLIALTPRSWLATVAITVPKEETATAQCVFEVDTTGQIVTLLEKDFWESEADELAAVLRNQEVSNKSTRLAGAALKQNLAVLGLAVSAAIATIFFLSGLHPDGGGRCRRGGLLDRLRRRSCMALATSARQLIGVK